MLALFDDTRRQPSCFFDTFGVIPATLTFGRPPIFQENLPDSSASPLFFFYKYPSFVSPGVTLNHTSFLRTFSVFNPLSKSSFAVMATANISQQTLGSGSSAPNPPRVYETEKLKPLGHKVRRSVDQADRERETTQAPPVPTKVEEDLLKKMGVPLPVGAIIGVAASDREGSVVPKFHFYFSLSLPFLPYT